MSERDKRRAEEAKSLPLKAIGTENWSYYQRAVDEGKGTRGEARLEKPPFLKPGTSTQERSIDFVTTEALLLLLPLSY